MKEIKFVTQLLVFFLVVFSCQKYEDLDPNPKAIEVIPDQKQQLIELQKYFQQNYQEGNRSRTYAIEDTDQELAFEGLSPQWEESLEFRQSDSAHLIAVPLKAKSAVMRIADGVKDFTPAEWVQYRGNINTAYLISSQRGDAISGKYQ